jgi:hypothetical protein
MKRAFLCLCLAAALTACNSNESAKSSDKPADTKVAAAADEKMDYAYTIEHPDQWEWGSKENTKMVLQSLKHWEQGNIQACLANFGDSIHLKFDGLDAKMPRDSVSKMFTEDWKKYKSVVVNMEDFESVKSKANGMEYVSLWYKQKWEDQKGVWDSIYCMDDLQIKNGKIISIDSKSRKYPKK